MSSRVAKWVCVLVAAAASAASQAQSQEEIVALDEIVVSATKREESLQRVPISVNAVSQEQLQQSAVTRLQDMQLPSLTVQEGAIGNSVFIRGIGSGINPGFEQSAGTYVDGIYRGRAQQSRAPLFDLQRIELLRGPQTTLLGKNSIAGAINVTTARPTEEFAGYVSANYDFDIEEQLYEGAVSGPIGDRVRGRLAARKVDSDGYMLNLTSGQPEMNRDDFSVRGMLEFDATDNLTVLVKAEFSDFDKYGRNVETYRERPAAAGPFAGRTYAQILNLLGAGTAVLNNVSDYVRSGNPDWSRNESEEYLLGLDWKLGENTLTAITGYSKYTFNELCDCDFTGANIFNVTLNETFDQFSQEIRLTSPKGETLDYIVGLYYEDTKVRYDDTILVDSGSLLIPLINGMQPGAGTAIGNTGTPRLFSQDGTAYSVFGSLTWNLDNGLHITAGARLAQDEKEAARSLTITSITGAPLTGAPAVIAPLVYASVFNVRAHSLSGDRDGWKFMPSLSLQYDFRDDVMGYLSVSRGNKSGGYDARSNNPTSPPAVVCTGANVPAGCVPAASVGSFEFDDEQSTAYELGVKSRFADGRAELNAALYYTDYEDLQVSTFDGVLGFNVSNAGGARVQGLELDGRWQLADYVQLRGSVVWTDFEYTEFFGQCFVGQVPNAPDGRNCDYKGKTNQFVADLAGTIGLDFDAPIGERFKWMGSVEAVYSDEYFPQATLDPATLESSYTKINARLAFGDADGRWELAVLGRNLTDEAVTGYVADIPLAARTFGAPSYGSFIGEPRAIAVQAQLRF